MMLVDQLFGLEKLSQVDNLPNSQTKQTEHWENTQIKDPIVCRFYK